MDGVFHNHFCEVIVRLLAPLDYLEEHMQYLSTVYIHAKEILDVNQMTI